MTFTARQETFIAAFIQLKNKRQAAIEAGASERSAHVYADRMFKNDAVRGEIERRHAVLLDRYEVSADRIIRELAKIAFANVDDFICRQEDGSITVDFGTARREQMASLQSLEMDKRP